MKTHRLKITPSIFKALKSYPLHCFSILAWPVPRGLADKPIRQESKDSTFIDFIVSSGGLLAYRLIG